MATSQLTCCTCPVPPGYDAEVDDPLPKYRNKCGCPTAEVICESAEKDAQLCGRDDFNTSFDSEHMPRKRYKAALGSGQAQHMDVHGSANCKYFWTRRIGGQFDFDCNGSPLPSSDAWYENEDVIDGSQSESFCDGYLIRVNYPINFSTWTSHFDGCANPPEIILPNIGRYKPGNSLYYFGSEDDCDISGYTQVELTEEDTEDDALARATETAGTSCTSIYQLRTTSFAFKVRTVKFSIELRNLNPDRAYEGCARIRRRPAFSGTAPDGVPIEWEDVAPFTFGPITPTSANTEDGVTTTAEITDQTLVGGTVDAIGWEYQIESAHVWPVAVGCDCPTELGYTDPE